MKRWLSRPVTIPLWIVLATIVAYVIPGLVRSIYVLVEGLS